MKNLILMLMLIPFISNSQIGKQEKVDKWTKYGKLTNPYKYFEIEFKEYDGGKIYRVSFQNMKYTEITDICSFQFEATDDELKYLKQTLLDGCAIKKDSEDITLEIGNGMIQLQYLSGKNVRMWYIEDGKVSKRTWLSAKQIDKLFKV